MEASSPQVPQTDYPVFNFLKQKYAPASAKTATVRLTTAEITEQISMHMGAGIDPALVYMFMENNGYSYDTIGDSLQMEWLLRDADSYFDHGANSGIDHGAFSVGDPVEVLDPGLLALQRFAPKGTKPNNHGIVAELLDDGDILIEFPVNEGTEQEHSQVAPYGKNLIRKR